MVTTEPSGLFHYRRMAAYRTMATNGTPVPAWVIKDWSAYAGEVANRCGDDGRRVFTCHYCRQSIQHGTNGWGDVRWYVVETFSDRDGTSACPASPRRTGDHVPTTLIDALRRNPL